MSQNADVTFDLRTYSRGDFTALRAWVQRVPIDRIAHLYYVDDAPQVQSGLERHLAAMRQDLIERAILANPALAAGLSRARAGGPLTPAILDILVKAADARPAQPSAADPIARWLRPGTARPLIAEGITTLAELKNYIEARGPGWWRPLPRVGQLRAQAMQAWLNAHPSTALSASALAPSRGTTAPSGAPLLNDPLPLECISALPCPFEGQTGQNRSQSFCFIQAGNDLDAVRAYLAKFKLQPHTLRAYTREIERFLLWSVLIRKTPLSSALVADCEAYKNCLADPPATLVGPRQGRMTPRWRPFTGKLSPESQRQAVQILRAAFAWLVSVRYLAGNPWVTVKDPTAEPQILPIQVQRALPRPLWEKALTVLDRLCTTAGDLTRAAQWRAGRLALLLLGDSGLRRAEAAGALAQHLSPSTTHPDFWVLQVEGRGGRPRLVPVSPRTRIAINAHWNDLPQGAGGVDKSGQPAGCILQPLALPQTRTANERHAKPEQGMGYSSGGLGQLVSTTLAGLAKEREFDAQEQGVLKTCSAHALRHTFAALAIAQDLPVAVLQRILGHTSSTITNSYLWAATSSEDPHAAYSSLQ